MVSTTGPNEALVRPLDPPDRCRQDAGGVGGSNARGCACEDTDGLADFESLARGRRRRKGLQGRCRRGRKRGDGWWGGGRRIGDCEVRECGGERYSIRLGALHARTCEVREGRGSQGDVWRKHEARYLRRLHAESTKMPEGRREQLELSFELVQPLLWPVASKRAQASSSV